MMVTDKLLQIRYIVIADYPQPPYNDDGSNESKFIEGDLLVQCFVNGAKTFKRHGRLGHMSIGHPCCAHPERYPKIFRKLEWWEYRELSDMPEYVNDGGQILKATWQYYKGTKDMYMVTDKGSWHVFKRIMVYFEPATKEEWEAQENAWENS